MSELTTDDGVQGGTSQLLDPTETPSNGSSDAAIWRKRRHSQTQEDLDPNSNLSPVDESSSEVQEFAQMEIDDFGSGIIEYMRHWKAEIITRKMTHLNIVRKYIVWSKTPLSLFQEINLQSLFVYMDAYHPGVVCDSEQLPPPSLTVEAPNRRPVNFANPDPNSLNWLNNDLIARALLNQSFVPVGGSNPSFQDLNRSNHTIPVDASNRSSQHFNISNQTIPVGDSNFQQFGRFNQTIPVSNSNLSLQQFNPSNQTIPVSDSNPSLQQFNPSNQTIPVGDYMASRLGVPAWAALPLLRGEGLGPLVPNISAPNTL